MSLSAHSASLAGGPPPPGGDWGDSPYGSLITLGPRKFKKKPVLVLADDELAQAHLEMAMGGAEIMEMQPDPVEAPRPRQNAMLLGLAPMGAEEADEDLAAYPVTAATTAAEDDDGWTDLPEPEDEPEEEAEVQTWTPEDEPEEFSADDYVDDAFDPDAAGASDIAGAPDIGHLPDEPTVTEAVGQVAPEPFALDLFAMPAEREVPSIEEQLERMRERLVKRAAAAPVAAAPAPEDADAEPLAAAPESARSSIERLEIDDWSRAASLKGFIPPQERDLAPPALPAEPVDAAPAPDPQAEWLPEPEPLPEPQAAIEPQTEPEPEPHLRATWIEPLAEDVRAPDVLDLDNQWADADHPDDGHDAAPAIDEAQAALDAWEEHVVPVVPPAPRRSSPIRARLREAQLEMANEVPPSLLARLWGWLKGLF